MGQKLFGLGFMWFAIVLAYIFLAVFMPAFRDITAVSAVDMAASANMSQFPGTLDAVNSAPLWIWIIPGGVGVVFTAIWLKKR